MMPTKQDRSPEAASEVAGGSNNVQYGDLDFHGVGPLDDIVRSAVALLGSTAAFIILELADAAPTIVARSGLSTDQIRLTEKHLRAVTRPDGFSRAIGIDSLPSDHPFRALGGGIESFMSLPLVGPDGIAMGILGLLDMQARTLTAEQLGMREFMARQAAAFISEGRSAAVASSHLKGLEHARERLLKFQWLVEQSPSFHGMVDFRGDFYLLNAAAREAVGLSPDSPLTFNLERLVSSEDLDTFNEMIRPMMRKKQVFEHRLVLRRIDDDITSATWFTIYPIRGAKRSVIAYGLLSRDITAQEADDLRRDHLIREGVHRAGNLITLMSMIIDRTFAGNDDAHRRLKARARVQAVAAAQTILGTSSVADITDTVRLTLRGFDTGNGRIRISGPSAMLAEQQTQGLSLALYELATNALKYGALSVGEGVVEIDWTVSEQKEITLNWQESGGPIVSTPSSSGFGSTVLSQLIAGYFSGKSEQEFHPHGLRFVLRGKIDPV